jgi:hypothetical protein
MTRAVQRPDFQGLRQQLLRNTRPVTVERPTGPFTTAAFEVDLPRIKRVSQRIVRGLYYYHLSEMLPPNHTIDIYVQPEDPLLNLAAAGEFNSVDDDVFMYRWVRGDSISMWWLNFYRTVFIVGASGPPELRPGEEPQGAA